MRMTERSLQRIRQAVPIHGDTLRRPYTREEIVRALQVMLAEPQWPETHVTALHDWYQRTIVSKV